VIVVGLISGTSYDAVEAAAADFELDGEDLLMSPLGAISAPYSQSTRDAINQAMPPTRVGVGAVCRLDTIVGQEFAAVAERAQEELCGGRAEVIASHGQTLFHWVEDGVARGSLQLGQSAWIASRTGLPVVSDLRSADIAAGGHGAPLASTFDHLLLGDDGPRRAALNLGGIANVTVVGGGITPVAFDTGPANALIDAAVFHISHGAETFDRAGGRASRGRVDTTLLEALLDDPYYSEPAPKSTGKELFNLPYLLEVLASHNSIEPDDIVATLTMLTARTVGRALTSAGVAEVIASGGGTKNPVLMDMLRSECPGAEMKSIDEWGLPALAKEAYVFALLGWLTWHGIAGTVPSCTGARTPAILGTIAPPRAPLRLPPPIDPGPRRLRIVDTSSS
jgi:anhydro-N-acetylmuramic acid kinase